MSCKSTAQDWSKSPLFIAPLVEVASDNPAPSASVALPLVDSRSNEFFGETMLQFSLEVIEDILGMNRSPLESGGFHLMLAIGENAPSEDVLYAPDFDVGDDPISSQRTLLPNDECSSVFEFSQGCVNLERFQNAKQHMQTGGSALTSFTRTTPQSGLSESVSFAYAPVFVTSYRPTDASDLSRGVRAYSNPVWSIATGQTDVGLQLTFASVQSALDSAIARFVIVLVIVSVVAFAILIPISAWISMSITVPVTQLCAVVADVNR